MHPDPFIISLGFVDLILAPYTVCLMLGAIVVPVGGYWYARRRRDIPQATLWQVLIGTVAGGFIGARLLNVVLNLPEFRAHPQAIIAWERHGFSLYGGLLMAAFTGWVICRFKHVSVWRMADVIAPFLGIGIAIIRIGCFLQGCCFGKITRLPWGITFPMMSPSHLHQLSQGQTSLVQVNPVHPTQLYELEAALFGSLIAWRMLKHNLPAGSAMGAFLLVFTSCRLAIYFFRVMPDSYIVPHWFYPVLYGGLLLAIGWFMVRQFHQANEPGQS